MVELPNSWLHGNISDKIDSECDRTQAKKKEFARRISHKYNEGLLIDIHEPTITEYLSFLICKSRNDKIIDYSPLLQAFISYSISAHDFIADEHYYKNGHETLLKTHGKEYIVGLMDLYDRVRHDLAKTIQELGVDDASIIAQKHYNQIIEADRRRNCNFIAPLEEAITIQESIAGKPAKFLARLSGGNKNDQESIAHLVNAICTLEDLMHFVTKTDVQEPKSTIPISFLYQVCEKNHFMQDQIHKTKMWRDSVDFTVRYINTELSNFEKLQNRDNITGLEEFATCIRSFIQKYISPIQ